MENIVNINAHFFSKFSLTAYKIENDDRVLFTSAKCGSRYLNELETLGIFHSIPLYELEFDNIKEIIWVVRPPMDHFLSAIITEHNINIQTLENPNSKSSKIKVKKNDDAWMLEILHRLLIDITTEPMFSSNTNGKINYFGHYKPRYEICYKEIESKIDLFSKIRFIQLNELTEVISSEFKVTHIPNKNDYSFDIYFTKESLLQLLETEYLDIWKQLKPIIDAEIIYYELLLNYDYERYFNNKAMEIYKNLETNTLLYTHYKLRNFKKNVYDLLK